MLRELTTREDLEQAAIETKKHVDTIYFHFSIEGYLDDNFPESPVRVFVFPESGQAKYYFMVKDNVYIKPSCMMAHIPGTHFDRNEFMSCIREFRIRSLGSLDSNSAHLVVAKEELVKLYSLTMKKLSCDVRSTDLNLFLFFMNPTQRQKLMEHKDPLLPDGYYFDEIDPLTEGEMVNATWKHAREGDLEQTIAKLARLPSSCVKFDGLPVAFEMIDPAGFFNNQFVFEEHRRRGLGTAVEVALAKKCIRSGMVPYKTVDKRNVVALNASKQSQFWTQWTDEKEEKPMTVVFQEWSNEM
ncbi:unnamed protein product [Auanema sp. JU1783]|nr:unnamed protein product [Auanema sp. JU1783]